MACSGSERRCSQQVGSHDSSSSRGNSRGACLGNLYSRAPGSPPTKVFCNTRYFTLYLNTYLPPDITYLMTTTTGAKRQAALKAALSSDITTKNPVFSSEHIEELFNMFYLYSDPRSSKTDIRDVLVTARALGLDKKYQLVFRAMEEVSEVHHGDRISFDVFIKDLTKIIGNPFTREGRDATFDLLDTQGKGVLEMEDMRFINNQLRYNLQDEQLEEIIKNVGGYEASNISKDRFENFIERKIERVQRTNLAKRD